MRTAFWAMAMLPFSGVASAEAVDPTGEVRQFSEEEIAAIAMPETQFDMSRARVVDFEKYYYFHRDDTSFDTAFSDITECDKLASGLASYRGEAEPYPGYYANQYGIGGVIGGILGSVLADAIHGSAARREMRRVNMRNCMGYKGYQRYGIPKNLWVEFNFEEGGGREDEDVRATALLKQARVASGSKPTSRILER